MMTHTLRRPRLAAGAALVSLACVFATVPAAHAATTTSVTYDLQSTALGQTAASTLTASVTGTAPSSVAASTAFSIALSVGGITVPTSASGYTITQVKGIALKIPVPADSTYDSASLSGGSNYGSGTPSVSESSGVITISVPGPISAGTTFTLPTLTLNLTSGASGGTVTSTLSGTSFSSPGLTFTAVISVIGIPINAATVGYPTTTPTLTSTTIS